MSKLHHGFLDESGILERKAREGGYFVISVVTVANPAEIKDVMKIARRKTRGKFKTHTIFHAYKESEGFVKLVLNELAKRNVDLVVGVWDKRKRKGKVSKNELYRKLIAQTVRIAFNLYPRLDLVIHKRYTNPELQRQLHDAVVSNLGSGFIALSQLMVQQRKELELADAVAWAIYQKYNKKRERFYEIIKGKIKKESKLTA